MSSPEDKAREATSDKYWARWRAATTANMETDTSAGRTLLRTSCMPLRNALAAWMEKAATSAGKRHSALDVFRTVDDADLLSVIILRDVINGVTHERSYTSLALSVGTAIETEGRLKDAHLRFPALVAALERAQFSHRGDARRERWLLDGLKVVKGHVAPRIPRESRLRAGIVALDLVEKATGLIVSYNVQQGKKKARVCAASQELCSWLSEAHDYAALLSPLFPLLTHPPVPWSSPSLGGYVTLPFSLVKKANNSQYEGCEMDPVYDALNTHQETAWTVNSRVLEVMQHVWSNALNVAGIPSPELEPFPPKPADIDTNDEARREYGRRKNEVRSRNNATKSKRVYLARLLGMAKANLDTPVWQPACLDFRGRMYTAPVGLNSQGSDAAKGLLQFAKALPIKTDAHDATHTFLAYGAALYGYKGRRNEQVRWALHHKDELRACALDPFEHPIWCEAKEPWQFLSWLFEVDKYWDNPERFKSYLPIAIDASASGCQVWALLLRDEHTAKMTNVWPNELPIDLYYEVAGRVKACLAPTPGEERDAMAEAWRSTDLINRDTCKAAVMIIPFSGTRVGMANALYNKLQSYKAAGKTQFRFTSERKACYYLAGKILAVTEELIPSVLQGMRWAKEVSNICADHGVAVEWVTPTGMPVVNDYRKPKYKRVRTWMGQSYATSIIQEGTPSLSKKRCGQTIMANLTHSLDAAIACDTINKARAKGVECFSVIFDQFGTHALHLDKLRNALLHSVADMFSGEEDFLSTMREHLLTLLPPGVELPEPPLKGNFNPNLVVNSRHFAT